MQKEEKYCKWFLNTLLCWLQLFVQYNMPSDANNGKAYELTLLGSLLTISCIVKNEAGPYEFFDKPSRYSKQEHDITEANIHQVRLYVKLYIFTQLIFCSLNTWYSIF